MKKVLRLIAVSLLVISVAIGMSSCMKEIPIDDNDNNIYAQPKKDLPIEGMTTREFVEAVYAETEALFDAGEPFSIDLNHINEDLRFDVESGLAVLMGYPIYTDTKLEDIISEAEGIIRSGHLNLDSDEVDAMVSSRVAYIKTLYSVFDYDFRYDPEKNAILYVSPSGLEKIEELPGLYEKAKKECVFMTFVAKICSEYENYCHFDVLRRPPLLDPYRNYQRNRTITVNSGDVEVDNAFIDVVGRGINYYLDSE